MKFDMLERKLNSREDYVNLALDILSPLREHYSEGCARLHLGETFAHYDIGATYMEAFSRPLWALVPMWAGQKSAEGESLHCGVAGGSEEICGSEAAGGCEETGDDFLGADGEACQDINMRIREFAGIYRKGLVSGTDPQSIEYWGECTSFDQRFVEMAAIAYAMMFAPEVVWDPLSDAEKSNLATYLNKINKHPLPVCNWILFAVLVNIALKKVGYPYDEKMLMEYLDGLETFYIGEGWYMDGDSGQKDYYISYAIHFYSLVYATVMQDEDPKRCKLYKDRAMIFARQFIYWFDNDGDAIPFGRSTTYRFSQVSFFSACILAGIEPFPLPVMKGLIERHLRSWLSRDIFDRDGILTIGYGYPNLMIGERYNAPGSPYWGMKVFAFLILPKEHEFWKVKSDEYPMCGTEGEGDSGCGTDEPGCELCKPLCPQPCADMLVYHYGNHTCAFVPGVYSPRGHGHIVEKYSKFAYDSKFSVSMSRSQYELCEAVPDDMLAFLIDGYVYVRRICISHEITNESVVSVWSPYPGITVKTTITPNPEGHVRVHEIDSSVEVKALDCGFSVRRDDFDNYNCVMTDVKNVSSVTNKDCGCVVTGNIIESDGDMSAPAAKSFVADPNTNLLYQRTAVPAVEYDVTPGHCVVRTDVKCWWN